MTFLDAVQMQPGDDDQWHWHVPPGWEQGRGAWGGIVAGGVVDAVLRTEPQPQRRVRTVSIHMSAPLRAGEATVRVTPWRIGSAMSTWSVTVHGPEDEPVAQAMVITGDLRAEDVHDASHSWGQAVPPELPPWQEVDPLPRSLSLPGWPTFYQHLELRLISGMPMSGGPARCTGYVRFQDQQAWNASQVLGIVDSWFPTALTVLDSFRPMATVTFAAHLLTDPDSVKPSEPLVFESWMSDSVDGYTSETRRLWTVDGRLVVENHQSIVVVR